MRVPEQIELYRLRLGPLGSSRGDDWGVFAIPGPCGRSLHVIATVANEEIPWDHVSVSLPNRNPNWEEMSFIKNLFWDEEESVMQLHPPKSNWINNHLYCLHLWRPLREQIPLPPSVAVGYKEFNVEQEET